MYGSGGEGGWGAHRFFDFFSCRDFLWEDLHAPESPETHLWASPLSQGTANASEKETHNPSPSTYARPLTMIVTLTCTA